MGDQTVNGVPRSLLKKIEAYINDGLPLVVEELLPLSELRALLDAPVHTHAEIEDEPGEALSIYYDAMEACAEVERDGAPGDVIREMNDELATLRAAQPQGEPVLYVAQDSIDDPECDGMHATRYPNELQCVPLYAEPPAPAVLPRLLPPGVRMFPYAPPTALHRPCKWA